MSNRYAVVNTDGIVTNVILAEDDKLNVGDGLTLVLAAAGAAIGGTYSEKGGFLPPTDQEYSA